MGVCDGELDVLTGEGTCQRGTNLAGTNNSVLHKEFSSLSAVLSIVTVKLSARSASLGNTMILDSL